MDLKAADVANLTWRKSTKSGPVSDNCVEIAPIAGGVVVRNSKSPEGPFVGYTTAELKAFIEGAKDGEFDDLI